MENTAKYTKAGTQKKDPKGPVVISMDLTNNT